MDFKHRSCSSAHLAVLTLASIVSFSSTALSQEKIYDISFMQDSTKEVAAKNISSTVEVHSGNTLLKEGVDYMIVEDKRIKIISEAHLHSFEPISISFQKKKPSKKKQSSIEGKQKE